MARSWLDYRTPAWVQWCPGCGNYGILTALYRALAELEADPRDTVIVSGIGCSSRIPYYVNVNGVHTIHGRAIPVALGLKVANPKLRVIVHGGDGDLLGIGAAHFVALGRRNSDITVILHDNSVYGLTKGQAGPTLPVWVRSKALKAPNIQDALDPLVLAIASGYTFVARGYAYHTQRLKELIKEAILHKGASLVQVLQPCPTYNNVMAQSWYEEHIYYIEDEEPGYDPVIRDPQEKREKLPVILEKATMRTERIALGIIMKDLTKDTFEDRIAKIFPGYKESPPAIRPIELKGRPIIDPFKVFRDRIV